MPKYQTITAQLVVDSKHLAAARAFIEDTCLYRVPYASLIKLGNRDATEDETAWKNANDAMRAESDAERDRLLEEAMAGRRKQRKKKDEHTGDQRSGAGDGEGSAGSRPGRRRRRAPVQSGVATEDTPQKRSVHAAVDATGVDPANHPEVPAPIKRRRRAAAVVIDKVT